MKLVYWVSSCDDAPCYWVRTKTKKECEHLRQERGEDYNEPVKVTVEYQDGFDLLDQCTQEGGLLEESMATRQ